MNYWVGFGAYPSCYDGSAERWCSRLGVVVCFPGANYDCGGTICQVGVVRWYYFPGADGISTKGLCKDNNNTKDGNSVITVYIW